ncbi:MAG: hypothetical protein DMF15_16145 [Verrucomicrobia bacterium]|nr:MAG: hypothetical protein DMF15_16145 [Verrucomicrobiota bacterium]
MLATTPVREATDEQLVRLPTGDGMALVFRHSAEEPARCALEIAEALQKHPELPVRMGIHSGPVSEVTDVSGRTNIAGAGINMAQRVMDCGDAGHILLSQHVADDLVHSRQWASRLRDLGECEVKHGVRLHLVNLYAEPLSNAAVPQKFQQAKPTPAAEKPVRRSSVGWIAALVLLAILAAGAAYYFTAHRSKGVAIPEKSIAVLPLVNSTGDPANEYFSDGMSEEFISSLSRLQELKVVGRTSSFQFKGTTDNSRTIGEKLGVAYLLEGSVRKSADRVRIAVALIKSGDGANVWSDTYDRELKDIFAVQSEIAGAVAKQLKVALLGNNGQTAQLTTAATPSNQNVEAYNALLQGNFYYNRGTAEDTRKAVGYYEEAIRLDPRYALAYAKLSINANNLATNYAGLATKEREEAIVKAHASAKRAVELDPNLADGHRAQGRILEVVDFNFADAEAEYRRAFELAPHDAAVMSNLALLMSDLGRIDEAVALGQRAIALDVSGDNSDFARQTRRRGGTGETGNRSVLAHLRPGAGTLCQWRPGRGRRCAEKNDRRTRRRRRQPDRPGLCPAQGSGEDVRVAGARLDDARRRRDPDAGRSFPARLQGRPPLHRLRAKDRGDAESRRQSIIATGWFAVVAAEAGEKDLAMCASKRWSRPSHRNRRRCLILDAGC